MRPCPGTGSGESAQSVITLRAKSRCRLVFNLLIVFAVGKTALQSYVFAKINVSEILSQVASAFPAAAPYYAGAIMYNTAIQVFLEFLRLGVSDRPPYRPNMTTDD